MAEAQISDDLTQLCYLQKPKIIPSEYPTLITDCLTLYEAWERLEERVPKETIKYEIIAQFKRLKPLPSKRSPSILREFANNISLFCRRMVDLGLASDNYSCVIMQDVYEHSDQDTALRYRSRIELQREVGILVTEDLDSLAAVIRSESTTLELSASPTITSPERKSAVPGKSVNALHTPENIASTKHDFQFNKSKCELGCETEHRLIDCTIYLNMSLEEKPRFIRTTLRCFICLGKNHAARNCPKRKDNWKCRQCQDTNHHCTLCP